MKEIEQFKILFSDKYVQGVVYLSSAFFILVLIMVLLSWTKLPPQVPFFYSRPWGEEQLATKTWFLYLLLIGFGLTVFNLRVSSIIFKKEPFLAKILVWTSALGIFLAGTTIIKVLWLII